MEFVEFTVVDLVPVEKILIEKSTVKAIREYKNINPPRVILHTDKDHWHVEGTLEEVKAKLGI